MIPKAVKDKIHSLLKEYDGKEIPDSKVHAIAEEGGVSPHDLESYIYSLASAHVSEKSSAEDWKDKIPGGLADKKKPSDFDPDALAKGKKVEVEHTSDPEMAEEIAMDHLTEDPKYYDKLETIEKKGSLRQAVIKLANDVPELRQHLIPLLRKMAADKAKTEDGAKKLFDAYKKKHPGTKKTPKDFFEKPKEDEGKKDEEDEGDSTESQTKSFKKDFDPKDFNGSDGWVGGRFPDEAAEDVSQPGSADEAVKYWVEELGWNVPADAAREYLIDAGIEEERVEEMDEDTLNEYTFWLAAGRQHEEDQYDKESSLRQATLKLAHDAPELRQHLIPLLREAAAPSYKNYVEKKKDKGERPLSEEEWERKVLQTGQSGEELKKDKAEKEQTRQEQTKVYKKIHKRVDDLWKRSGLSEKEWTKLVSTPAYDTLRKALDHAWWASPEGQAVLKDTSTWSEGFWGSRKEKGRNIPPDIADQVEKGWKGLLEEAKKFPSFKGLGKHTKHKDETEGEGKEPKKEKSKAELKKDYIEAIKKSDMSPEDKKKALERAKKPDFDPEAALGAMGDEEEEGKTAMTLREATIKLAQENPELRRHLIPILRKTAEKPLEEQEFRHPDSGNMVKFKSLPADEQKRIREKAKGSGGDDKGKKPEEKKPLGDASALSKWNTNKWNAPEPPVAKKEMLKILRGTEIGGADGDRSLAPAVKKLTDFVNEASMDGWEDFNVVPAIIQAYNSGELTHQEADDLLGTVAANYEMAEDEEPEKEPEKKEPEKKDEEKPKRSKDDVKKELDLTDDDEKEVGAFKKKLKNYKKMTDAQLMQKFMREAKPETKERMKGMSVADFMIMFKSIMDEEEGGKQAMFNPLRQAVAKLAHDVPEMRKHLIPILRRTAGCGDEQMAGRLHGEPGKGYGEPTKRDPGKWTPTPKAKCYYETGDEADRCYVTNPGKPICKGKTDSPASIKECWKKYEQARWGK